MSFEFRRASGLAALLILALVAGCSRTQPVRTGKPHQLKKSDMSVAEQKYGIAPVPDDSVTYQPDVIIVGGGAESVRSQNPNGFIWTIDADAARADELVPGKVFFLTNRAVGRVLDVRRNGGDLVVSIGPVDITEIVSEAHIHITDMPIDFGEALAYTAPDFPGQIVASVRRESAARAVPAVFTPGSDWSFYKTTDTPPAPDVTKLIEKNFRIAPVVSRSGIGIRVTADGGGLKVLAESTVHLLMPTLNVHLDITPRGGVTEASVELKGAAGLSWKFFAGTDVGLKANVNGLLQPDTDFSIPVGGIGPVPLAVTVRQRFLIKTGLGVRNSTLSAQGDYTFNGGFRVGYVNKTWGVAGPIGFTATQSMARTGGGLSLGAEGINLADQIKVIVGVGAFGFAAGPYFSFTSAVGALKQSDIGMIACTGATLDVKLSGGVGYVIPKSITGLVNSILAGLNIKYRITGEGGLEPSEALTIVSKTSQVGGCKPPDNDGVGTVQGPV